MKTSKRMSVEEKPGIIALRMAQINIPRNIDVIQHHQGLKTAGEYDSLYYKIHLNTTCIDLKDKVYL